MNAYSQSQPLTDEDLARVDTLLERANPDESMIVEELDGFFAALACSPDPVPRDEWLPEVLGVTPDQASARLGDDEAQALERLLERHRGSVAAMLYDGQGFSPVLAYDEAGNARGNAWAVGFVRGIGLRPDAWSALDEDDQFADALEPVMQLVEEVESDQDDDEDDDGDDGAPAAAHPRHANGTRPAQLADALDVDAAGDDDDDEDFDPDEREALLQSMIEGVMDVYDFFREEREKNLGPAAPIRRAEPKVGRNDPCPCGSGRKYKACHGA